MKNTIGIIFICISAFLYGIWYLSAAIYGSGMSSWSRDLFKSMLEYVGPGPLILSCISLITGLVILLYSNLKNRIKIESQLIKENWKNDENWL
ncbi:MAG: hypothetical protein NAG76_18645 [Candidatus Pristimantibacillus lignocellulolyticus]|uniref:Uncharacterized protein n=1 Tax=Candidatus Pristimantibacillus lignocellulolyticus TaxID=2994561 RepID=A0A9J6ZCJ1_9BACL|nr:MAG: hypothetical protein NAG76_18645 [Candidatus Pristimantibacillus lignocellulolyticus]